MRIGSGVINVNEFLIDTIAVATAAAMQVAVMYAHR
jgi:hypothetical protein